MRKINTNLFYTGGILAVFSMMILSACPMLQEEPEPTPEEIAKEEANAVLATVGSFAQYSKETANNTKIQFSLSGGEKQIFDSNARISIVYHAYGNDTGSSAANIEVYTNSDGTGTGVIDIPVALLIPAYSSSNTMSLTVRGMYTDSSGSSITDPVYSDTTKTIEIPAGSFEAINGTLAALSYAAGSLTRNDLAGTTAVAGSIGTLTFNGGGSISLLGDGNMPAVLIGHGPISSFTAGSIAAGSIGAINSGFDFDAGSIVAGSFTLGSTSVPGTLSITDFGSASSGAEGSLTVYFGNKSGVTAANTSVILKAGNLLYEVPQFGVLVTLSRETDS
jgi:hypothetical protein